MYICFLINYLKFKNMKEVKKTKIDLSLAVSEVRDFVTHHNEMDFGKLDEDDAVIEKYPNIVSALQAGLLVIDEKKNPVYTLRDSIEGVDNIVFKTRVKPMEASAISKGLEISKNQYEYILRCVAHLTQQPKGVINNLSKYDFKVIEQICTLFL